MFTLQKYNYHYRRGYPKIGAVSFLGWFRPVWSIILLGCLYSTPSEGISNERVLNENANAAEIEVDKKSALLSALLEKAEDQLKRSLLTLPAENNAYETFQQVLKLSPDNPVALAGLTTISDRYEKKAQFQLRHHNFKKALKVIDRGLSVNPSHEGLWELLIATRDQARHAELEEQKKLRKSTVKQKQKQQARLDPGEIVLKQSKSQERVVEQIESLSLVEDKMQQALAAQDNELPSEREQKTTQETVDHESESPNEPTMRGIEPVKEIINENELDKVIKKFITYYDNGDLETFLTLFAPDAVTNTRVSLPEIRKDYEILFSKTTQRAMRLSDITWERIGEVAIGLTNFDLKLINNNESGMQNYSGNLTFNIRKSNEGLVITGLFHSQSKVDNVPPQ